MVVVRRRLRALNLEITRVQAGLPFIATKIVMITSVNACDYSPVNSSRERQFEFPMPSDNLRPRRKKVRKKRGKRRVDGAREIRDSRCNRARAERIINIPRAFKAGRTGRREDTETEIIPGRHGRWYRDFMQKLLITEARDESVRQRVALGDPPPSRNFVTQLCTKRWLIADLRSDREPAAGRASSCFAIVHDR